MSETKRRTPGQTKAYWEGYTDGATMAVRFAALMMALEGVKMKEYAAFVKSKPTPRGRSEP